MAREWLKYLGRSGEKAGVSFRSRNLHRELMAPPLNLRAILVMYKDDIAIGGSIRVGGTLAVNLASLGVDVRVVFVYGGPGPVSETLAGTHIYYVRATGPRDLPAWKRFRNFVRGVLPDILHFIDPVLWAQCATSFLNIPRLVHVHGATFPEKIAMPMRFLSRVRRHVASGHVCISNRAKETLINAKWSDPSTTWVVRNGVDISSFDGAPSAEITRKRIGLPIQAKVLGLVARLDSNKGGVEAIRMLRYLPSMWHLAFIGKGDFKTYLQKIAEDLGLTERVHFTGARSRMSEVYPGLDGLLFLSRYESFGLVLAEAMAARVPIVGLLGSGEYREGPIPLITAENALLLERSKQSSPVTEPEATLKMLADQICLFFSTESAVSRMTSSAYSWVSSNFTARQQAENAIMVYKQVCKR